MYILYVRGHMKNAESETSVDAHFHVNVHVNATAGLNMKGTKDNDNHHSFSQLPVHIALTYRVRGPPWWAKETRSIIPRVPAQFSCHLE